MKLKHQQAVVSYCQDLTDPRAKSVPIGIMLVGEVGGDRFAGLAFFLSNTVRANLDAISREILEDVPNMLRRHVDDAAASIKDPKAPLDTILRKLHHDLRNSLHVADIRPVQERDIAADETGDIYSAIVFALTEALNELGVPPGAHPTFPPAAPRRKSPDMSMWRVRGAGQERPSLSA